MIHKICPRETWHAAEESGVFLGLPDDVEDGFIHFSTTAQVPGTLEKHFAGQDDLLLVTVDPDRLDDLRWEPSRRGELFPHLYGPLPIEAVIAVEPVEAPEAGR
jgi:uncharacterized protein (DUF952 family)